MSLNFLTTQVGYFNEANQTYPAFDPGLEVDCPVCNLPLSPAVVTISLMKKGGSRSYFYRVDKGCYERLSEEQQTDLDSQIIDHL